MLTITTAYAYMPNRPSRDRTDRPGIGLNLIIPIAIELEMNLTAERSHFVRIFSKNELLEYQYTAKSKITLEILFNAR